MLSLNKDTLIGLVLPLARCLNKYSIVFCNSVQRIKFFPVGFRAHYSTQISWSVSADAGGDGGRIVVGENCRLDIGVILRAYGGFIEIGNNCSINPYCVLYGGGGLRIGNGVRMAAHCVIVPSNHIFDDPDRFICLQGESREGISIEDDVWIGAGARVLDGVTVGKGAVIGAGAVVTKSIEPYSVVVGVPAKKVSSRLINVDPLLK